MARVDNLDKVPWIGLARVAIVFVHGVANRVEDPAYNRGQRARDAMLSRFVAPAAGIAPGTPVVNPYWGDHAARFAWGHASLPIRSLERFGGEEADEELVAPYIGSEVAEETVLVDLARRSLEEAMDLLLACAASGASDHQQELLADLAFEVTARLPELAEALTGAANDDDALDRLAEVLLGSSGAESFGAQEWAGHLGEGLSRLRTATSRAGGRAATELIRAPAHAKVALFLGDVLVYLAHRGTEAAPGPIVNRVADALASLRTNGEPLVVVAHSLGGIVTYDVLSRYRPEVEVDVLVTIGSQVGLFAELTLLRTQVGTTERPPKLPALPNVRRWLNVLDRNDLLAFAAEKIFEGVSDTVYSTGRGVAGAHSAYFRMPSFYRRLATRLSEP